MTQDQKRMLDYYRRTAARQIEVAIDFAEFTRDMRIAADEQDAAWEKELARRAQKVTVVRITRESTPVCLAADSGSVPTRKILGGLEHCSDLRLESRGTERLACGVFCDPRDASSLYLLVAPPSGQRIHKRWFTALLHGDARYPLLPRNKQPATSFMIDGLSLEALREWGDTEIGLEADD